MRLFAVVASLALLPLVAVGASVLPQEAAEIDRRLTEFYLRPWDPSVMDRVPPKFDARTGRPLPRRAPTGAVDPLLEAAGIKASEAYRRYRCRTFWRRFPGQRCEDPRDAAIEPNDDVADLAETWMARTGIVRGLRDLPREGSVKHPYWSGDYWRTRWGLTSYRYVDGTKYATYREAVAAYRQPEEWLGFVGKPLDVIAKSVRDWSPSEKYDLTVGSAEFLLTREQKSEGEWLIGPDGNVEEWFGLCHGWAPAAVLTPAPEATVTAVGASGVRVTWYPHDLRAMVTLAWSNGDYAVTFAGTRCDAEKPERLPNGRLAKPECFDSNPATFHLALANLVGKLGQSFVMDASFDAEVANHTVISYSFEYFDPLSPQRRSGRAVDVAVPYDDTFRASDRFQKPLTRGVRKGRRYDDSRIDKMVGVIATVVYLDEIDARPDAPGENATVRVSYTYDLELEEREGVLAPTGGEWHNNVHPDFFWLPEKGAFPTTGFDTPAVAVSLSSPPSAALTRRAEQAVRQESYPLQAVIKALIQGASSTTRR